MGRPIRPGIRVPASLVALSFLFLEDAGIDVVQAAKGVHHIENMRLVKRVLIHFAVLAVAFTAGCTRSEDFESDYILAGNPDTGRELMYQFGCGSCHVIPGVPEATGTTGPPLDSFRRRSYLGASLPNTPANLARWIVAPQKIDPATAMPSLDVTFEQAGHMVAYFYSLQ